MSRINCTTPFDDSIDSVFHVRKSYRNIGLIGFCFFVLMGFGSAYVLWYVDPPQRRANAVLVIAFSSCVWSVMSGLSIWILLAYWRGSLKIRKDTVIDQGVIHCKEVYLPNIREARWKLGHHGCLALKSTSEKLTVYFDNFEPAERLRLIQYFRDELPHSIQDGWDLFCYKIAIPLRNYDPARIPDPSPQEVTLTRRRWDWIFIPFILLSAVIGIVIFWKFQLPRMLAAPLLPIALWLLLRFGTPKQGMVAQRVSADKEHQRLLVFFAWWIGILIAGFVVYRLVNPPMPRGRFIAGIALFLWVVVFLWRQYQYDLARQQREMEAAKLSAQMWGEKPNMDVTT